MILDLEPIATSDPDLQLTRLQRFDGATGELSWSYKTRNYYSDVSQVAVHPNGAAYFVERIDPDPATPSILPSTDLVGLNAETGQETSRRSLGTNIEHVTTLTRINPDTEIEDMRDDLGPISASHPIVTDDGSVVVL